MGTRKREEEREIEEFGVSGELLAIARSLKDALVNKLGIQGAQTSVEEVFHADYGRARRQKKVETIMSLDDPHVSEFLHLRNLEDVNAVLQATLILLDVHQSIGVPEEENAVGKDSPTLETDTHTDEPSVEEVELSHITDVKGGWWFHEAGSGKHSEKLTKNQKQAYESGERVEVTCNSCRGKTVGHLKKESLF